MKTALKDEKAFAVLDLEFHMLLANASGNVLISDLISLIRSQLMKALHKVLLVPHALPLSHKEHTAIVDAIERHDAEGARSAMHTHLEAHLRRYTEATGNTVSAESNESKASKNGHKLARIAK